MRFEFEIDRFDAESFIFSRNIRAARRAIIQIFRDNFPNEIALRDSDIRDISSVRIK